MTNLSQQKREEMLAYLDKLRDLHCDDESLRLINQIQSEINNKRYGLIWEEHSEHVDEMLVDNIPVFVDVPEKTIKTGESTKFNFLLEGDNLHSLKLLRKTHTNKIDVIYIDPPYNTGNKDFIYNDCYVDSVDSYSHSKWLSFMHKRLVIAKELLNESGVIFISIDDNEQPQLRLLCNSIFGERNFIGEYVKQSKVGGGNDSKFIVKEHEYCLCYSKNIQNTKPMSIAHSETYLKRYKEEDEKGRYFWDTFARPGLKNPIVYEIEAPDGTKIKNGWIRSKARFEEEYKNGTIKITKKSDGEWSVQFKQYLNANGKNPRSMTMDFGGNKEGSDDLEAIFGAKVFSYPKSVKFLKTLFSTINNKNILVLDFFAGSGTTGHALQQLNKEDGGNRTYILCTNNENNICEEVTYQRLSKIQEELPHNLRYYRTDFVAKHNVEDEDYSVTDATLEHIRELIELEHQTYIDGVNNALLLDNDEIQYVLMNVAHSANVYTTSWIFLEAEDFELIEEKEINIIIVPDYYFENELIEVGEL